MKHNTAAFDALINRKSCRYGVASANNVFIAGNADLATKCIGRCRNRASMGLESFVLQRLRARRPGRRLIEQHSSSSRSGRQFRSISIVDGWSFRM
jgi:hypothetical protein